MPDSVFPKINKLERFKIFGAQPHKKADLTGGIYLSHSQRMRTVFLYPPQSAKEHSRSLFSLLRTVMIPPLNITFPPFH